MKGACKSFEGGNLPAAIIGSAGRASIAASIRDIAKVFVDLQELRHSADYDLTQAFERREVLALIDRATLAISQFQEQPSAQNKELFLLCLLTWRRLSRRR